MYYQKQSLWQGRNTRGGQGGSRGRGGWYDNNNPGLDGRAQNSGRQILAPGMKGFLCTTNFRESFCIREAYNILNEYAPPEVEVKKEPIATVGVEIEFQNQESKGESMSVQPCSVSTAIKTNHRELSKDGGGDDGRSNAKASCREKEPIVIKAAAKNGSGNAEIGSVAEKTNDTIKKVVHRFKSVATGIDNVCFISATIENPLGLTEKIYEDVLNTKLPKSRNILRFIPIEMTCLPKWEEIIEALKTMLPQYLGEGIKSYKVEYRSRCNSKFNRTDVMRLVMDLMSTINPTAFVDLVSPVYTIMIEVVNKIVCLGVLTNYVRYRKYNLAEAAIPHEQTKPKKKNEEGLGANSETAAAKMDAVKMESSQVEKATESVRPTENVEDVVPTEYSKTIGRAENSKAVVPTEYSKTVGRAENSKAVVPTEYSKIVGLAENSKAVVTTGNSESRVVLLIRI